VKWYGEAKSKSEYRLTGFGKDFPFRTHDNVGDLLVIVIHGLDNFHAYVLDQDDDIEEIEAALGVEVIESWESFPPHRPAKETPDQCLERQFRAYIKPLTAFPSTSALRLKPDDAWRHV